MNYILRACLIVIFITSFILMSKAILLNNFPDFNNFYYSPTLIFNNINPYIDSNTLFTSQTYPPHVFIIVYPLQFVPLLIMSKIWTVGSIIALLLSIYLLLKINKESLISNTGLLLSSLVFLSFPVKFSLGMGQINIYILLLLTLFIFYFKKNEILSGVFLFASLALKIFPIFIPIYLLLTKKWKMLTIAAILTIVLFIVTYIIVGWEMISYFLFKIFPTLITSWKGDYYNQSLSGVLIRTGFDLNSLGIIRLIISSSLAVATFTIILMNKTKRIEIVNLKLGAILVLNVLVNNFSWQHHFVWLIPSFFFTFFYLRKNNASRVFFILLAFSYALVAYNIKSPNLYPTFILSNLFWGGLLLLGINLYLLTPKNIKNRITLKR